MNKFIRYINSILDYYSTRRSLNKGGKIISETKISEEILEDDLIEAIVKNLLNTQILEESVKYRMVLKGDYEIGIAENDFIFDFKTIKITLRKR